MHPRTAQIHNEFQKELNVSVIEAPVLVGSDESVRILEKIGLKSSKTYLSKKEQRKMLQKVEDHNSIVNRLLALEAKYPQYRIITLSRVMQLCEKYGLVVGKIEDYTEMIPEENIREIEQYMQSISYTDRFHASSITALLRKSFVMREDNSFFIAAPARFFRKELTNIEGFMVDLPKVKLQVMNFTDAFTIKMETDPIVLQPLAVVDKDVYMHIPSAWDVEANDEHVVRRVLGNLIPSRR
jgi:hypothetical protein